MSRVSGVQPSSIFKNKPKLIFTIALMDTTITKFSRYKRGLETCPQAKKSKSGHAIIVSFFRRILAKILTQRRVENTRVHFWTFSPVSVNKNRKSDFLENKIEL